MRKARPPATSTRPKGKASGALSPSASARLARNLCWCYVVGVLKLELVSPRARRHILTPDCLLIECIHKAFAPAERSAERHQLGSNNRGLSRTHMSGLKRDARAFLALHKRVKHATITLATGAGRRPEPVVKCPKIQACETRVTRACPIHISCFILFSQRKVVCQ